LTLHAFGIVIYHLALCYLKDPQIIKMNSEVRMVEVIGDQIANNVQECTLRPVHYGYDPVGDNQESTPIIRPHPSHPYFERSETNDSAYLDPRSIRVPWSSTFPGCRQSKHWLAVQNAVRDFFNTIKSAERGNQDQRGNDIEPEYSTREKERMETAVSCSIYMFPEGSSKRAELISTLLLMSFIHDGASIFAFLGLVTSNH
jgi:hypothetical protein